MKHTFRIYKLVFLIALPNISLFCMNGITLSTIEKIDTNKLRIVYKEIKAERKIESINEKSLKYLDGKNAFHSEHYFWALANILYNTNDFRDVQDTGGKYTTIFGNINNQFKDIDIYYGASYLTNEELGQQVKWHKSLQFTDFESYKEYYNTLIPEVKKRLLYHKNFTLEKQFQKLKELFSFYKKAYENGSWVLIHIYK